MVSTANESEQESAVLSNISKQKVNENEEPPQQSSGISSLGDNNGNKEQQQQQQQRGDGGSRAADGRTGGGGGMNGRSPSAMYRQQQQQGMMKFGIPTNADAANHARTYHGHDSWQHRALQLMHSNQIQVTLMVLLLLDVLILFTEVFLMANYPMCHFIERDAISCCPSSTTLHEEGDDAQRRFLLTTAAAEDDHDHHHGPYCSAEGLEPALEYEATCDTHKWHKVHTIEKVLFVLTVIILSIFMLQLNVEMVALTPQVFFGQFFYLADYVIVALSLTLEITLHLLDEDTLASLVGLLAVSRIWRFVRIGHGIVSISAEVTHHEKAKMITYIEDLEELLDRNNIPFKRNESIHRGDEEGE